MGSVAYSNQIGTSNGSETFVWFVMLFSTSLLEAGIPTAATVGGGLGSSRGDKGGDGDGGGGGDGGDGNDSVGCTPGSSAET